MILGHVRDGFPRVTLTLPGNQGPLNVEFIIDTAFDGELSLPNPVLAQVQAALQMDKAVRLADGRKFINPLTK